MLVETITFENILDLSPFNFTVCLRLLTLWNCANFSVYLLILSLLFIIMPISFSFLMENIPLYQFQVSPCLGPVLLAPFEPLFFPSGWVPQLLCHMPYCLWSQTYRQWSHKFRISIVQGFTHSTFITGSSPIVSTKASIHGLSFVSVLDLSRIQWGVNKRKKKNICL